MNKQRRNLDTRIAEALADEATKASEFNRLIIDVEYALPLNFKALEAERIRMLDPTNSTPNKSKKIVEDITLERERLEAALPILQDRYNKAERRQNVQAFKPRYNKVVNDYNKCSETLFNLHHEFVEHFVPLLDSTIKLNHEIRQLNAEVHNKWLTEFPAVQTIAKKLIELLVLPGEAGNHWPDPRVQNAVAAQWAEAMTQVYSSPLRQAASSPDWAAARAIQDEGKIKEWEKRNALQEEQQLKARQEFERSKQQVSR